MAETADRAGHRPRLRERFLNAPEALPDYELLELFLFQAQPRKDMKPIAKALLGRFGSFAAVIAADPAELKTVDGVGDATVVALKTIHEAARRLARDVARAKPVLSNHEAVLDYCQASLGHGSTEQFRVLYLNRKNEIIHDELQQRGTVDQAPVYPREVLKRALEHGATALILVHNHPSGDPTPSAADVAMTREVKEAAAKLGIELHDHLVVARGRHASLRSLGLI